ncbi:hypothetical protein CVT24_003974 [Panaeolus cyanescens]|uniref:C4-dicarboxylate transporter/malic acid transport protein n=1 Tax=Panaeolus cyanescens TaxID=181874 RepID=A0A409Y6S5_9AGAR|nr:hypothetical protein CVT24_003974 [Panaeolus cyanescens]
MFSSAIAACRLLVRRTSPIIFAITMGTGAISGLFGVFPYAYHSRPIMILSLIVYFIDLFLFTLFTILAATKYICYPKTWVSMFQNPVNSLVSKQSHHFETMTAMWLLPVVTVIVTGTSGGVIANAFQPHVPHYALMTTVLSAFMVSIGLSLALMILTIYFMRLVVHGLPAGPAILSVFLPLGPTAQSGLAISLIGESFHVLIPLSDPSSSKFMTSVFASQVIETLCICISFVLWSLATMWACYALLAIGTRLKESIIPFRPSFWGLVFPNCVYANLTIRLAGTFDSTFFRVFGSIYAIATLILWICISIRAIWELRLLIVAPEISENITCASNESKIIHFQLPVQASARTSVTQLV